MAVLKQILTEIQEEESCSLSEATVMFNGGVQPDAVLPCPFYDDCACSYINDWRSCPKVWAEYEKEIHGLDVQS